MEWTDRGVILGARRHGEQGLIVEALTYAHGRHLGLVRGGRSVRHRSTFQPGNSVTLTWRARLEDHLGVYSGEMLVARAAAVMEDRKKLSGLAATVVLGHLLAEREPVPHLADKMETLLDQIAEDRLWLADLVRFELLILGDLGFGLDLTECALTGATEDLVWISPKTGRAASAKAGEPYKSRLFRLPKFLRTGNTSPSDDTTVPLDQILEGFRITGHFLNHHIYRPRSVSPPEPRAGLLRELHRKS